MTKIYNPPGGVDPSAHTHSKLVASDGSPDPALSADSTGKVTAAVSLAMPTGATIDEFSIDGTLAGNSDTAVPTEKATKTYTDQIGLGVAVYNSSAISVDSSVATTMTFDSERRDDAAFHSTASNTSRLSVPAGHGGWYVITGTLSYADDVTATGVRDTRILLNGTTLIGFTRQAASADGDVVSASTIYYLSATDYVELVAQQSSGTTRNINSTGNFSPEFRMVRIFD